jgi:DNA-binding CsgD family transcriptional regulator
MGATLILTLNDIGLDLVFWSGATGQWIAGFVISEFQNVGVILKAAWPGHSGGTLAASPDAWHLSRDPALGAAGAQVVLAMGASTLVPESPTGKPVWPLPDTIAPPMRRAQRDGSAHDLVVRIRDGKTFVALVAEVLDAVSTPLMVVAPDLRVLMSNQSARAAKLGGEPIVRDGVVALVSSREIRQTRQAVNDVTGPGGAETCSVILARGEPKPAILQVRRIPGATARGSDAPLPLALIVLIDPECRPRISPATLRRMFQLTPAESSVFSAVVHGDTPREIAGARGVSVATVRFQLKQIFRKVGVSRRADLVTLAANHPLLHGH